MKKGPKTEQLGNRLRCFFEAEGYSQAQLAVIYDVKQSWISRIFNGEFTERSSVAKKMCEQAGIPFETDSTIQKAHESEIQRVARQLVELKKGDLNTISKLCGLLERL